MLKAKQIDSVTSGFVRVSNFSASGINDDATMALSAACAIAGRKGVSVPVQSSDNEDAVGVSINANHIVQIQRTATAEKIADSIGNEVYGRITEIQGGGYLLSYFVFIGGAENPYNFVNPTGIDFDFVYRYSYGTLPADYAVSVQAKTINNDPRTAQLRNIAELLNVTALNVLSLLTYKPSPAGTGYFFLIVNGEDYSSLLGIFTVNIETKLINWSAVNAKFNLTSDDKVVAFYTTSE